MMRQQVFKGDNCFTDPDKYLASLALPNRRKVLILTECGLPNQLCRLL